MPLSWAEGLCCSMLLMAIWAILARLPVLSEASNRVENSSPLAIWITRLLSSQLLLLSLKLLMVGLFFLVIICGLYGTPLPQQNLATELTWNIWWAGLIVSVFFLGSGWCAICPWDTIASYLTRLNILGASDNSTRLNLAVPGVLRSVWPALLMLLLLSWLELGYGITADPYATALLAMLMLIITTTSHALFERKAFCRYFCPVGRTIGFYSQLAPVALRPVDPQVCSRCETLECYRGSEQVEPCPTGLLMKNLKENSYCTSCTNCVRSCPTANISWKLRPLSQEARQDARPRHDEAWFVIALLALALLHGLTMMPIWEQQLQQLSAWLGESGLLLWGFTILLATTLLLVASLYAAAIAVTMKLCRQRIGFKKLFIDMAFMLLPLAFGYHIAHNLTHLWRENSWSWLLHPFGLPTQALPSMSRVMPTMGSGEAGLFILQSGFMLFGFCMSLLILRHRAARLASHDSNRRGFSLLPLALFALLITILQLWLLTQPMMMRF
ncbi:MAG: 4Fe-4S binding protein [Mariprofundus sp.]|nr:4Fe-4S binding protein [Mariprofundus sp.]